jgi:hypothetical protein
MDFISSVWICRAVGRSACDIGVVTILATVFVCRFCTANGPERPKDRFSCVRYVCRLRLIRSGPRCSCGVGIAFVRWQLALLLSCAQLNLLSIESGVARDQSTLLASGDSAVLRRQTVQGRGCRGDGCMLWKK